MAKTDDNYISADLTEEQANALIAEILKIQAKMPFLISFTKQQRKSITKPSEEAFAACGAMAQIGETFPDHFPKAVLDVAELRRDYTLGKNLKPVLDAVNGLSRSIQDTLMAARSDSYRVSLQGYGLVKMIESKLPGVAALIAGMRKIFERPSRTKTTG